MATTLEFIFDFASPNGYLAYRALPPIIDRTGATLAITPCLLGGIFKLTGNQAPWAVHAHVPSKLAYDMLEIERFIAKHELSKFKMSPHFPPNTLLSMRGLIVAQGAGCAPRYIEAVLSAMWENSKNISDPAVLVEVLCRAGMDGAVLLESANAQEIKDTLTDNTKNAVARGVFGVPTFFVEDDIFFGKDRLMQVEEALGGRNEVHVSNI